MQGGEEDDDDNGRRRREEKDDGIEDVGEEGVEKEGNGG